MKAMIGLIALRGAAWVVTHLMKVKGLSRSEASKHVLKVATEKHNEIAKVKKAQKPELHRDVKSALEVAKKRTENTTLVGKREKITKVHNQQKQVHEGSRQTENLTKQEERFKKNKDRALLEEKEAKLTSKNKAKSQIKFETDIFDDTIKVGTPEELAFTRKARKLAAERRLAAHRSALKEETKGASKTQSLNDKSLLKYNQHKNGTRNK